MRTTLLCLLLLSACGPNDAEVIASDVLDSAASGLSASKTPTGIPRLVWNGRNLFGGVGGYYIIGTCTGADDANNVISYGGDGHTLVSTPACRGAPYSIRYSGDNPIHVRIDIGPLPQEYRSVSVPLDPAKDVFTHWAYSGSGFLDGCGNSWVSHSGSGGAYAAIRSPCIIPNVGNVGVARTIGVPAGRWGEGRGPGVVLRRTVTSTNAKELVFINHPGTNNIEIGWGTEPIVNNRIPAGSVLWLEEDLWVGDPQIPPPAAVCNAQTQRAPDWGVKNGQCLRSCGQLGGSYCAASATCPSGYVSAGASYDCTACCRTGGGAGTGGTDGASLSGLAIPQTAAHGSTFTVMLRFRNSGTSTWSEGAKIRLGTGSDGSNALLWVIPSGGGYGSRPADQRLFLRSAVAPGAEATFAFSVRAPTTPGSYRFTGQMVHEAVTWFGPQAAAVVNVP